MSDVLKLQDDQPEAPDEEKGSWVSVLACHKSYRSLAFCLVK
jgi:hypothetical protein